jgi:predicted nuclease of predicted toxin-antitoxin system
VNGFILDENIPSRFTFTPRLPVIHAGDLGQSLSDSLLWEYAKSNECVIVTKDADFSSRIMLSSPPPWVVHLRIGNMRKRDFHAFLHRVWPRIESFLPTHKLVNVFFDRIEGIKA